MLLHRCLDIHGGGNLTDHRACPATDKEWCVATSTYHLCEYHHIYKP